MGTSGMTSPAFVLRFPSDRCNTGGTAVGYGLFQYLCLGGSRCVRTVWVCRLVYRDAEFPFSDVYSDHAECGEYRGESGVCVPVGDEDYRGGSRDVDCPVCRIVHGFIALVTILWQVEDYFPVE